jgi:hypothetical protein
MGVLTGIPRFTQAYREDPPGAPQESLLLVVASGGRLAAASRPVCDMYGYATLHVSAAESLIEVLRFRRPAAVVCADDLPNMSAWFVLARLAHVACDADVLVETEEDLVWETAFDSCKELLGLTRVLTLHREVTVEDVGRLLARAGLRRMRPAGGATFSGMALRH